MHVPVTDSIVRASCLVVVNMVLESLSGRARHRNNQPHEGYYMHIVTMEDYVCCTLNDDIRTDAKVTKARLVDDQTRCEA